MSKGRYGENKVRIRLYRWKVAGGEPWGIVYADHSAREKLLQRLTKGSVDKAVMVEEYSIEDVKSDRVREGWRRNAIDNGAVMATGLGAF